VFGWFKKERDPKRALIERLGEFEVPSFPEVVLRALATLRDPNSALSDIADTVAVDPGLTIRLIRLVNSPAYGLRRTCSDVGHAISLVGRSEMESILLLASVPALLHREAGSGFDPTVFWYSAARRASIAGGIAEVIEPTTRLKSFTATLLSDMGVPLISRSKGAAYDDVLAQWRDTGEDLMQLEQQALAINHAEVGTLLCDHWAFPESLRDPIACHHGQGDDAYDALPAVALVSFLGEDEAKASDFDRLVEASREVGLGPEEVTVIVNQSSHAASAIIGSLAA